MALYEVKEERCRLVCEKKDTQKVLDNIKTYDFLHLVDTYDKVFLRVTWTQIIVDSDRLDLDNEFVKSFNKEVGNCLGTFEEYIPMFD